MCEILLTVSPKTANTKRRIVSRAASFPNHRKVLSFKHVPDYYLAHAIRAITWGLVAPPSVVRVKRNVMVWLIE